MKTLLRVGLMLAAVFVVGPMAGLLTGSLRGPEGGHAATLLVGSDPLMGVLIGLAAIAMAAAMGVVSGRLCGIREGFFDAGLVLCWAAWRLGNVDDVLRVDEASARMTRMALEGGLFGAIGLLAAALVMAAAWKGALVREGGRDQARNALGGEGVGPVRGGVVENVFAVGSGPAMVAGALVGAVVALAVAGLIARNGGAGQAVFAGIGGGVAAAAAGRLTSAAMGRDASLCVFVASCVMAAALGPVIELIVSSPIGAAVRADELLGVGRVGALAWMGGAMIGAPWGARWFHASIERQLSHA